MRFTKATKRKPETITLTEREVVDICCEHLERTQGVKIGTAHLWIPNIMNRKPRIKVTAEIKPR